MANTMNDTRTPGEILADAVELAEKTGHSYITVTNVCAERIIELLKNEEELGEELGNAVELIRKKDERIKKLLKEQQPKTARWEKRTGMMPPEYHGHYWCSNCEWHGRYNEREADYKYCPACGAKMEKQP